MAEWLWHPATTIAAAVRAGEVTARAVVAEHLAQIRAIDGELGAFRVVRAQRALAEADVVDTRADRAGLPLAGVPLAVKDNTAVAGETARRGSAATPDEPAAADDEVVRRLRAAGAVVVGLSSMPDLGLFPMDDSVYGIAHNPWCPERTPGGSSGGAAVAVAAGMIPVAQGNDGLGSIRLPAACCGLVGLKPGSGVLPPPFEQTDPWFGLAEHGPLATTVADAALLLAVMAGRPEWAEIAVPDRPLRVAVSTRPPVAGWPVDREYQAAARAAGETLAHAGHGVRAADPPYPLTLGTTALATWCVCADGCTRTLDRRMLDWAVRGHARAGRLARRLGLPRPEARQRLRNQLEPFFAQVDVLVTPALAQPPPAAVRWGNRGWLRNVVTASRYSLFAPPWNLTGWPAAVVPAGLHRTGVPLAVQLVAPPGGERMLLAIARQLELHQPWPRHAPAYNLVPTG
jgi:amidase